MRIERKKRRAAISASALCAAGIFAVLSLTTGCTVKFGTTPKDSDIIARPANSDISDMEISYGEFNSQYLYYLKLNEIEDDTAAEFASQCKEKRSDIIDSMIFNKIYLQKAKELGVYELSEDEKKEADDEFESQIKAMIEYHGKKALGIDTSNDSDTETSGDTSSTETSSSGASFSEEEITAKGSEALDKLLAECNMTRDTIRTWYYNYIIATHVAEKTVESVTREDAEADYAEGLKELEDLYNSNNSYMYYQGGYFNYWIPEGSRLIKHVLLGFDDDTKSQITALREDGKDDEANALRAEKSNDFTDKIAEVNQKLDDNEDFNTILLYYSSDAAGSSAYPDGYLVTPNDPRYHAEFTEAAFTLDKIGDRTICTTDDGVHIMIYAGDAKVDEAITEMMINSVYSQLRSEASDKAIEQWRAEFNYTIDYEKLRIDPAATEN